MFLDCTPFVPVLRIQFAPACLPIQDTMFLPSLLFSVVRPLGFDGLVEPQHIVANLAVDGVNGLRFLLRHSTRK